MKISFYTISLNGGYYKGPAVPLLDIFPMAKAWGYDGIEIEAKRPHGSPLDLDKQARETIKKTARDNGLEISCIAAYNDFSSPVEEHRENELLMAREQIKLAVDLGAPVVRVMAAWSGVTRRDGCITYDIARVNHYDMPNRFPGTIFLEYWSFIRECLKEVARMAEDAGVILALQNHKPITGDYRNVLEFVREVDSPALKVCLDSPLCETHGETAYRKAIQEVGDLMVFSHYGGRFKEEADGSVVRAPYYVPYDADDYTFLKAARDIIHYEGHVSYELCTPVYTAYQHEGLDYALKQSELACRYMRNVIASV